MISIITVVKNGVSTIEETILSVINQDYQNIEFIIIDGVSTDGTLNILDKYKDRISKIVSEPDDGVYDAMNKGISIAEGDWVYFLGCDDVLYNSSILSNIFSETKYKNFDVVYGNVKFLHSGKIYDGEFDVEKMSNRSICHQAIFYRRKLFKIYGFFDTEFKSASDYIFNIKHFCRNVDKWLFINEIVAIFNETGISQSTEEKYLDESFAIRYESFRNTDSKYILSKIFWSSYFRYLISHNLLRSAKYLILVINDVGIINLAGNLIKMIKRKYLYSLKY